MKTFRVYFRDGNQKLLEAENMVYLMDYIVDILIFPGHYEEEDIVKIEEVE